MFLQVCVCPQEGCYPSMHCRWYPSMSCSRTVSSWGSPPGRVPAPRWSAPWGGVAFCYGLLLWSSVMAFWFGDLLLKVVFRGSGYNRRPPHQKAITSEGTTTEGYHTRRPPQQKATTPEGHHRVGCLVETPQTATAVGGMHPTGMHSSFRLLVTSPLGFKTRVGSLI